MARKLRLVRAGRNSLTIVSDRMTQDTAAHTLIFSGHVSITTHDGMTIAAPKAVVDGRTGFITIRR